MRYFKVTNIDFDTDGNASLKKELKKKYKEMYFLVRSKYFQPQEELADKISDETGFCIFGYHVEEIKMIS
jgi:hypothetical protein